jgi:guanine deaminase
MNKYMKIAIEEARKGIQAGDGGPFGAVIVKIGGGILGRGHNRVVKDNDPTCHGEISAIRDACKNINSFDLSGCEIYTTGEPCPMCLGAILWSNVEKIYYGCTIKENEMIGFRDNVFYDKLEISTEKMKDKIQQIDHEECLKLFKEYMEIKDKVNY